MLRPQGKDHAAKKIALFGVTFAVAPGACGEESGATSVAPEVAGSRIERAAQVKRASEPITGEAREQGMEASDTNSPTAVNDRQVVGLSVTKDSDVADEVFEHVRASAPKSAKPIVEDGAMVLHASAGAVMAGRACAAPRPPAARAPGPFRGHP